VQLLRLPYNILFPMILLFTVVGVFASSNNVFDLYVMIAFGIVGYLTRKLGYEAAPLVLAFVLGAIMENKLRTALIISAGDLTTFVTKPISAVCLSIAAIMLLMPLIPQLRRKREVVALEDGQN
jgi:putative tricarboxylic transport membrane protein